MYLWFLHQVFADRAVTRDKGRTIKHFFQRLSVLLQRGNANMIFSRGQGSNLQNHLDGLR
jgi:hypothetical protein